MKERAAGFHKPRFGLTPQAVLLRLLPLLLLVLIIRQWVWMPVLIRGESMLPTLRGGQLAGVNKLAYLFRPPRRGDIVEVWTGKDLIVKRVVGLPGEEVAARGGTLYVNGSPLPEPYAIKRDWNVAAGKLDFNSFLVVGDNRFQTVAALVGRERIVGRLSLLR
jgi:signal peptidase I